MEQIGFCQQPRGDDKSFYERIMVSPDRSADLTLEKRTRLIHEALGRPLPPILQIGQPVHAEDKLIFTHIHRSLYQATLQDTLVIHRDGVISFERCEAWDATPKPAYEGDKFVQRVITNCVRGVNFSSTTQLEGSLHVELCVSGLFGSSLIFNPPHQRYRTKCAAQGQIYRHEIVRDDGSCSVVEQIKELTLNLANEILGNFQLSGYAEYLSPNEFGFLFDAEFSSLKFSTGILASPETAQPAA